MAAINISVFNLATTLTDTQAKQMVTGINKLLPTFCSDWNLKPYTTTFVLKNLVNTTKGIKLFFFDDADTVDALGYHDIAGPVPYGKVFVRTTTSYGGGIYKSLTTTPSVATVFSHEVFEIVMDLYVNTWWLGPDWSTLWAAEVCDPVQGNLVRVAVGTDTIVFSDWILPAWSNPNAVTGPFNHNKNLRAPFTVDLRGYAIQLSSGNINYVFGSLVPDAKKEMIQRDETRGYKANVTPVTPA